VAEAIDPMIVDHAAEEREKKPFFNAGKMGS
jgi:hypothetical protein